MDFSLNLFIDFILDITFTSHYGLENFMINLEK